jgi:glucose/arabinose dehydrogenase
LLTFDQPQTNHNGGWLGFSPRTGDEGNLYIATGDGGNANDQGPGHIEPGGNAQNTTTLLGKCCGFTQTIGRPGSYSIPADNPFFGSDTDKQEIWAFGLRNPFRNSFDRLLGTMFIADVGQDSREEIDAQAASENRRRRKLWLAGARRFHPKSGLPE